jgi:hypothetical protein
LSKLAFDNPQGTKCTRARSVEPGRDIRPAADPAAAIKKRPAKNAQNKGLAPPPLNGMGRHRRRRKISGSQPSPKPRNFGPVAAVEPGNSLSAIILPAIFAPNSPLALSESKTAYQ